MSCSKPLNTEVIPSGPGAFQLSVIAISRDTCSVVIGMRSIAVTLDTLVYSLPIQHAFKLCLTAFPQVDTQKAVVNIIIIIINDRLCGLVVRVSGYR